MREDDWLVRLVDLVERFVSLPLRDRQTLSRVAEALAAGLGQDGPEQTAAG